MFLDSQKSIRFLRLKKNEPKAFEIGMNLKNKGIPYQEAIKTALNVPNKKSLL